MKKYDIFISYRRDGAEGTAGRISDKLVSKGYKVFFDVETMRSGDFNEQIYEAIDSCSDMLVVLPPNGLDRCREENDWVRLEIAYAVKNNKNIIPIFLRNFEFPDELPDDIKLLPKLQGIFATMDLFDAVIERIEKLLRCRRNAENLPQKKINASDKIKIPFFLRTPLDKKLDNSIYISDLSSRYWIWWNVILSGELPENDDELQRLILDKIDGRYRSDEEAYFLEFIRDYESKTESLNLDLFRKTVSAFKNINKIEYVPKRYNDTDVNVQALMYEISDLAQTCFYNADTCVPFSCIMEFAILGWSFMGHYPRKADFSFMHVVAFCLKFFFREYTIKEHYISWPERKLYRPDKIMKYVSRMISMGTQMYHQYEDGALILNNRVKFLLKYFQLMSFFLCVESNARKIKKYLLINYKYLRKNGVVLSEENEELFEKLINIYSQL